MSYSIYSNNLQTLTTVEIDLTDVNFTSSSDDLSYHFHCGAGKTLDECCSEAIKYRTRLIADEMAAGDGQLQRYDLVEGVVSLDVDNLRDCVKHAVAYYMLKDPSTIANGDDPMDISTSQTTDEGTDVAPETTFLPAAWSWNGTGDGGIDQGTLINLIEAMGSAGHLKVDNSANDIVLDDAASIKSGEEVSFHFTYAVNIDVLGENDSEEAIAPNASIFPAKTFPFASVSETDATPASGVEASMRLRAVYSRAGSA